MKKKVFNLFVLLMLLTSAVSAQVKLGVKAGANINDVGISGRMHYKTTNYLGFSIGPTANIDVPRSTRQILHMVSFSSLMIINIKKIVI